MTVAMCIAFGVVFGLSWWSFVASWNGAMAGERLFLAAGERGTPAYQAGIGLASLIKVELGPLHKIDMQAISLPGSLDNIELLRRGDADLAIVPAVTGHAARAGIGAFTGHAPAQQLRAVTTLWLEALHLVLHERDVSTGTIDDLFDLKDRKVFLGKEATAAIDANHVLFSAFGLDAGMMFDVASTFDGDPIQAIKQGRLDAVSMTMRAPSPLFQGMDSGAEAGMAFLAMTTDQVAQANGSHWLWTPYTIPAATYPG